LHDAAQSPAPANPEDGKVTDGTYTNEYFRLAYQLPTGWRRDWDGPAPSYSGYYVLAALSGDDARPGTMLIAAHDQFFAAAPAGSPADRAGRLLPRVSEIDGMRVEHELSEMITAGRRFARLDFSGAELTRTTLVSESRCHFISFNLTTSDPAVH